jgi:hypothetical protein
LPYAVKQIVIQELETARLQRMAQLTKESVKNSTKLETSNSQNDLSILKTKQLNLKTDENIPNFLKQLNPIELKPTSQTVSRFVLLLHYLFVISLCHIKAIIASKIIMLFAHILP